MKRISTMIKPFMCFEKGYLNIIWIFIKISVHIIHMNTITLVYIYKYSFILKFVLKLLLI